VLGTGIAIKIRLNLVEPLNFLACYGGGILCGSKVEVFGIDQLRIRPDGVLVPAACLLPAFQVVTRCTTDMPTLQFLIITFQLSLEDVPKHLSAMSFLLRAKLPASCLSGIIIQVPVKVGGFHYVIVFRSPYRPDLTWFNEQIIFDNRTTTLHVHFAAHAVIKSTNPYAELTVVIDCVVIYVLFGRVGNCDSQP